MYGIVSKSSSRILKFQNVRHASHSCKILVLGGGCGGCTIAAKFSKKYKDKPNDVIIVEPSEDHYYQPIFTLIGAGVGKLETARKKMKDVLPKDAQWLKDSVVGFDPENCKVTTKNHTIQYEILIVALGLQTNWNAIPGLAEGLKNPDAQVCSIYGPNTVSKVFEKIKRTKNGSALFTFPNSPIKCPGAPQKIAYLAEDYWRKQKRRDDINVVYNTTLPVIFGVKKYADSLWEVCKRRNINVNLQTNLIEIKPDKKEAVFQNLKNPEKQWTSEYSLLHVSPPMSAPDVLKNNSSLTNEAGFLSVSPKTLQHTKYSNIYGLGDCTSSPNSKTMAAIAPQSKVVYKNIMATLEGKEMDHCYDGYASCPLVTAYGKCILAEFDYNLQPRESLPFDQGKESYVAYLMKKEAFPFIYWNLMLRGYWNGPKIFRDIFRPFEKTPEA